MKDKLKYIIICLSAVISLSACSEYDIAGSAANEGEEVILKLKCQVQTSEKITVSRATSEEQYLNDLRFYVFNAAGTLTGYKEVTGQPITTPGPTEVKIKAVTGQAYIYAVANIENSVYYLKDSDKELLTSITEETVASSSLTRNEFLGITFSRRGVGDGDAVSPNPIDGLFLMSGYLNDGKDVTIIRNADGSGSITTTDNNIIKLYRGLAKNQITIEESDYFTPTTYELHNVANGGILVRTPDSSTNTDAEVESLSYISNAGETIDFYLPENIRKSDKEEAITQWKDRETNTYTNGIKSFTNAPDNASYIVINGNYKKDNIIASVSYTVHLGNFSNSGSLSNFDVLRNHSYKYKITVVGVEDIEVEATTENGEDNPYAEGLVINTESGKAFDLDAHYEARVLEFDKKEIENLKAKGVGYILKISTPFGETDNLYVTNEGVFKADGDVKLAYFTENGLQNVSGQRLFSKVDEDYNWIRFLHNTSANRIQANDALTEVAKYPGDENQKGNLYGNCVNVFQMLKTLYEDADKSNNGVFDADGKAYYTCFVDENYYSKKEWTDYTNKPPRTMLIANKLSVSKDQKSLYAEVRYSIPNVLLLRSIVLSLWVALMARKI